MSDSPAHKKAKLDQKTAAAWTKIVSDVLSHEKNKDNLDTRNIVLATVKDGQPYARYHVHREFVPDAEGSETELLLTTTDARMPKVDQIQSSSESSGGAKAEYLFWASGTGDQIRIRGNVHLYLPGKPASEQSVGALLPDLDWEAYRIKQWKALSSHLRASFLRPTPGSTWPKDKVEEFVERLEVGGEGEDKALERFSLVVFEPKVVDRSQQNATPPYRDTWTKQEDGSWAEQKVAP